MPEQNISAPLIPLLGFSRVTNSLLTYLLTYLLVRHVMVRTVYGIKMMQQLESPNLLWWIVHGVHHIVPKSMTLDNLEAILRTLVPFSYVLRSPPHKFR